MLLLPWGRNVNNFVAASKASGIDPGGNRGKSDWEGWMDQHSSPSSAILGLLIMIMKNVRHGSCFASATGHRNKDRTRCEDFSKADLQASASAPCSTLHVDFWMKKLKQNNSSFLQVYKSCLCYLKKKRMLHNKAGEMVCILQWVARSVLMIGKNHQMELNGKTHKRWGRSHIFLRNLCSYDIYDFNIQIPSSPEVQLNKSFALFPARTYLLCKSNLLPLTKKAEILILYFWGFHNGSYWWL